MFNSTGIIPTMDINGNGNNGMWGDGGWWVILILFALFGGWGNNGFGGGNEMFLPWMLNNNNGYTDATIQRGFDNAAVTGKLDTISSDICQGFANSNTATQTGFANLATNLCGSFDAVTAGINNLGYNLQTSLLNVTNLIDGVKYENAQNASAIIQAGNANTQRIVDLVNQNTMQDLRDQLTSAKGELSQVQQTSDIVNQLQPVARPAYVVQSPYQSQMYGCGCNSCGMA